MSEALPFLVITVGFDKPYRLAKAVFDNPDIEPVAASPESPVMEIPSVNGEPSGLGLDLGVLYKELAPLERLQRLAEGKGVRWAAPVAAKHIVIEAVGKVGVKIVRDYAIEIAVLSVGAASGIGGLREFCYLGTSHLTLSLALSFPGFQANLFSRSDHGGRLRLLVLLLRCHPRCHGRGPQDQAHPWNCQEIKIANEPSPRFQPSELGT